MGRVGISLVLALAALGTVAASAHAGALPYDLNGDGRQEIVAGLPWWSDAAGEQGAVVVLPGDRDALFGRRILLTHESLGMPAPAEYDRLGQGIASGDFDNDGRADLAVGATGLFTDPDDGNRARGAVVVTYGDDAIPGERQVTMPGPPVSDSNPFRHFGTSLVAGDLNGDRFSDLVIAATSEDPVGDGYKGGGGVYVLFGSSSGLTGVRRIARPRRSNVAFGSELALGDPDGDGRVDVLEGARGYLDRAGRVDTYPGHLNQLPGDVTGPASARVIRGAMDAGPNAMAMGDVTGDGYDDLVMGISRNHFYSGMRNLPPGAVKIWAGGPRGLVTKPIRLDQNSPGIPGGNQPDDLFGSAVVVTRIDRDRYADMVIGAYGEDRSEGRVTIIRGGPRGYSRKGNRALHRGMKGVPGTSRGFPWFGKELSVLDVNGDGRRDLVVGAPGEYYGAGAINVFPGFGTKGARVFKMSWLGRRPGGIDAGYGDMQLGRVGGD